jgi:phenylalanyl-tRNA synthetase alpha chain
MKSLLSARVTPLCKKQSRFLATYAGFDLNHTDCNVTTNIASRIGVNLHCRPLHPLFILQQKIATYFGPNFTLYDKLSPIVSTRDNFDALRIPPDHPSRSKSDTYYFNRETCLRTHTSAHQIRLLQQGLDRFLVSGDVYRRDEIDKSHYPVFHQCEGVKLFDKSVSTDQIQEDLKYSLEGLAQSLFGPATEMRWVDEYFPFTHPSLELEIFFQDEWMEVLGCGVIHPQILENAGRSDKQGWAFGLGLERLAMVLFQIPDIRLFWTDDPRFHEQFKSGDIVAFQSYSKFPSCYKDVSFWLPQSFHVNDLNEMVRDIGGDLVEEMVLIDEFTHPNFPLLSDQLPINGPGLNKRRD